MMMMTKDISPWSIFRSQIGKRGKALEILLNLFDEFNRNWRYLGARPSVRVSFPHHSLDQFLSFVFYPIDWITSPLHWPTILWVSQYNNESEQSRRQIVSPFLFVFFLFFISSHVKWHLPRHLLHGFGPSLTSYPTPDDRSDGLSLTSLFRCTSRNNWNENPRLMRECYPLLQ